MIARQAADGMLPTRFAEDGSVDEKLSRTVKAETGPVALFLLELYQTGPRPPLPGGRASRPRLPAKKRDFPAAVVRFRDLLQLQSPPECL